jgi:nicotinamide riboside kinase
MDRRTDAGGDAGEGAGREGRPRSIAVVGSHGVRKSTAVAGIARAATAMGLRVSVLGEVIRTSPHGHNEAATPLAQLWVLTTQVSRELAAAVEAPAVLVADRSVVDNFAYYSRAAGGADPFGVRPLVAAWAAGYALHLRLLPDVPIEADGFRSPDPAFRDEIEAILDRLIPQLVPADRLEVLPASSVTMDRDWRADLARWLGR